MVSCGTRRRSARIAAAVLFALIAVGNGGGVCAAESDDQYALAAGHYAAGRWKPAAGEFQTLVAKYPGHPKASQAVFYWGEALLQLGQYEQSAALFRQYLGQQPGGSLARPALFRAAEAAYLAGKYEQSKTDLERFRATYPQDKLNGYVLSYLGEIALVQSDPDTAAANYRAALGLSPHGRLLDDSRLGLGRALEMQNRPQEAEPLYRAVLQTPDGPLAADAQYRLGALQYASGKFAEAVETFAAFDTKFAASPLKGDACLGRGWALAKLGRLDEAKTQLAATADDPNVGMQSRYWLIQIAWKTKDHAALERQAEEFDRRFPQSNLQNDVHRLVARSLVDRAEHARAVKILEPLVDKTAGDAQALEDRYLLSLAYEGLGRHEPALAVLLVVLDSAAEPLKTDARLAEAAVLVAMRRYDEAVTALEAVLKAGAKGDVAIKANGQLAICHARAGRLDKAKTIYADLSEKYPEHQVLGLIAQQLAEAAYEKGDAEWATQLFRRVAKGGGDANDTALRAMAGEGWSQFKAGRLDEAADTFERLLKKNPPAVLAAEAGLMRGRILQQQDRGDAALAMYDMVIDKYPKTEYCPQAMLAAARLREKREEKQQAADLYRRLADEYPQSAEHDAALYNWGWTLSELKQTDPAAGAFERLLREHAQSVYAADAALWLAQRAQQAKDYARAEELVAQALAGKADTKVRQQGMYLRGQALAARGKWEPAGQEFARFVQEFPDSPRRVAAEYWVAEADYQLGSYESAADRFARLKRQIGDRRETWMGMIPLRLAQSQAQLRKWNEAYATVSKIEADYPGFPQQYEADYLIGRCLQDQAELEGARKAYQRVIDSPQGAKTETAAMAQWMTGETYFLQKDYPAALREYYRVETLYAYPKWQAAALLQAGKCCQKLGKPTDAADCLNRLLKKYPDIAPFADSARKLLKEIQGK